MVENKKTGQCANDYSPYWKVSADELN